MAQDHIQRMRAQRHQQTAIDDDTEKGPKPESNC